MKNALRLLLSLLILQSLFLPGFAQQKPPYWDEIEAFKKQDNLNPPPKNAILFVGSSSFRAWKDVQSYFPNYTIINRGFGGSTLPDLIRYAPDIIFPYQPRQIVIYCGENDFVTKDITAEIVFDRFKTLFGMIREELPNVHILFVSFKPSPSRLKYMPEMVKANDMIKTYLKKHNQTGYVDVFSKMLLRDGRPIPTIFKTDQLHMNEGGYRIWQKAIRPHLKR